jgi:3-oxoadipate enol-lactonase
MPVHSVAVPGCRLQVVDDGAGPPIVLLHAGVADVRAWDGLVPPLVAAGYRVVRFDARGYGRSTTDDVAFSPRADLLAVMDALDVERAALVGNSRGGMIAFDTAIEFPDRVVAVVGVGSGVGGYDGGSTPEEEEIERAYELVDSADPFDAAALTEFEVGVWGDGPGQPAGRLAADLRTLLYEMGLPLNEPDHVRGHEVRLDPPAAGRLGEIGCPVLAVAGTLDFSGVAETARMLETHAPHARALVWDDVAHMIGMEQPQRLAAAIVAFLAPLEPWS